MTINGKNGLGFEKKKNNLNIIVFQTVIVISDVI